MYILTIYLAIGGILFAAWKDKQRFYFVKLQAN